MNTTKEKQKKNGAVEPREATHGGRELKVTRARFHLSFNALLVPPLGSHNSLYDSGGEPGDPAYALLRLYVAAFFSLLSKTLEIQSLQIWNEIVYTD